jgi:uncharacterized protein (DUF433 family)
LLYNTLENDQIRICWKIKIVKKRKFTCYKCGKENFFDPKKTMQIQNVMERVGARNELAAYHLACLNCGEENYVRPSSKKGVPSMSEILNRVEVNAKVMQGKPVIRGTRIPVELVLRKLGEGATQEQLLEAYPKLEPADLLAALAYAAHRIADEEPLAI